MRDTLPLLSESASGVVAGCTSSSDDDVNL